MTLGNNNGTDGQTDGQTDRVRRNMRPPPREEVRIIIVVHVSRVSHCWSSVAFFLGVSCRFLSLLLPWTEFDGRCC